MAEWEFKHSIYTEAQRTDAWAFWSSMEYQEREPGVKRIELDGPFETGTTGRTITPDSTQELELTTVTEGKHCVITGHTPDGNGMLRFDWEFKDKDNGTRITQHIKATGPLVEEYPEEFRQMEVNVPGAMQQLAEELNRLAGKR